MSVPASDDPDGPGLRLPRGRSPCQERSKIPSHSVQGQAGPAKRGSESEPSPCPSLRLRHHSSRPSGFWIVDNCHAVQPDAPSCSGVVIVVTLRILEHCFDVGCMSWTHGPSRPGPFPSSQSSCSSVGRASRIALWPQCIALWKTVVHRSPLTDVA